ncbi:MAG: PHP domain-containing protein, partial [Candidatus Omnitrophica bacterium]|nr:PHP domain-containing protein [Candidatus Omnitrophota bacterium]
TKENGEPVFIKEYVQSGAEVVLEEIELPVVDEVGNAEGLKIVLVSAPWRNSYKQAAKGIKYSVNETHRGTKKDGTCIFCNIEEKEVVFRAEINGRKYKVAINLNPFGENHVLLISDEADAQDVSNRIMDMALFSKALGSEYMPVFNSPGSGASVLHFHAQFIKTKTSLVQNIEEGKLKKRLISDDENVKAYAVDGWFGEITEYVGSDIALIAEKVKKNIETFKANGISYNIAMSVDKVGDVHIYFIPGGEEQPEELLEIDVTGASRIGGHEKTGYFVANNRDIFNNIKKHPDVLVRALGSSMRYYQNIRSLEVTEKPVLDMHMHSTCSDGKYSPSELLTQAKKSQKANIKVMSITDHDVMDAYSVELFEKARTLGIELVAGAEITSMYSPTGVESKSFFTELVGLFPRLPRETDKNYANRISGINKKLWNYRPEFVKCVLHSFIEAKEETGGENSPLKISELIDEAINQDHHPFESDKKWREKLKKWRESLDESKIEDRQYWIELLTNEKKGLAFRKAMPRKLYDFSFTLNFMVKKLQYGDWLKGKISDKWYEIIKNTKNENELTTALKEAAYGVNGYFLKYQDKYLGRFGKDENKPEDKNKNLYWYYPALAEVISFIQKNGGVAVMAHPIQVLNEFQEKDPHKEKLSFEEMKPSFEKLFEQACNAGLDGVEAFSRGQTPEESMYFYSLAKHYDLFTTNGSDMHNKPKKSNDRRIGIGTGIQGNQTPLEMIKSLGYKNIISDNSANILQTQPTKTFTVKNQGAALVETALGQLVFAAFSFFVMVPVSAWAGAGSQDVVVSVFLKQALLIGGIAALGVIAYGGFRYFSPVNKNLR